MFNVYLFYITCFFSNGRCLNKRWNCCQVVDTALFGGDHFRLYISSRGTPLATRNIPLHGLYFFFLYMALTVHRNKGYLSSSLLTYEPPRSLRASNEKLRKITKRNRKSFGERSLNLRRPLFGTHCRPLSEMYQHCLSSDPT